MGRSKVKLIFMAQLRIGPIKQYSVHFDTVPSENGEQIRGMRRQWIDVSHSKKDRRVIRRDMVNRGHLIPSGERGEIFDSRIGPKYRLHSKPQDKRGLRLSHSIHIVKTTV